MYALVSFYLTTGSKSTHLTALIRQMNRTQAVNLKNALAAEQRWLKESEDFRKARSHQYRSRVGRLLRRLEKKLKNAVFPYEVMNGLKVQRHAVLSYAQFKDLFVSGSRYEKLQEEGTLNAIYMNPDSMKILHYHDGDVTELTASNTASFQDHVQLCAMEVV